MSRIGRLPIPIPSGVDIAIDGQAVSVKGPKGALSHVVAEPIVVERQDGVLNVTRPNDEGKVRALHGLSRTLIANMVTGVTDGYSKTLEIVGVGYRAAAAGPRRLDLQLGFSHPVAVDAPEGVEFEVPVPTRITVRGYDKQLVGQVAADIRKIRKPEPYKGKGIRYVDERVLRKAGKSAK